jgi:hypothetical protein
MVDEPRAQMIESKRALAKNLDTAGWGLFFIWVGIAFLAPVSWGVGLLGVGIITLAGQLARKYVGLPIEGFWLFVGALFLLGGLSEVLGLRFGSGAISGALVPILCIVAGAMLLLSSLRHRTTDRTVR